jgi:hypothetical protein
MVRGHGRVQEGRRVTGPDPTRGVAQLVSDEATPREDVPALFVLSSVS